MKRGSLVSLALVTACQSASAPSAPALRVSTPKGQASLTHSALGAHLRGISGLAPAGDETFWLISELDRKLYRVALTESGAEVQATLAVDGAPEWRDLESVAVVATEPVMRLAFGTEVVDRETALRLVFGEVDATGVKIQGPEWSIEYKNLSMTAQMNRGITGLCSAGGQVMAIAELNKEHFGARLAPVGVRALREDKWRNYVLKLTSERGRIAGVACRASNDGRIEAAAIERHAEVLRLLRFSVPTGAAPAAPLSAPIEPTVIDLGSAFGDAPPNYESIAWVNTTELILVSDNDSGTVVGPTRLLRIRLP